MVKILPKVDGKSLSETADILHDRIKYRKYADKNYAKVIYINTDNTTVKVLDGKINGMQLSIPAVSDEKLINKVYISIAKKKVIKTVICKEDLNSTLDILATDISGINVELLKDFTKIKLMQDLQGFNLGQVILGGAIGLIVGFVLNLMLVAIF